MLLATDMPRKVRTRAIVFAMESPFIKLGTHFCSISNHAAGNSRRGTNDLICLQTRIFVFLLCFQIVEIFIFPELQTLLRKSILRDMIKVTYVFWGSAGRHGMLGGVLSPC